MKRWISRLLALVLTVAVCVGCGGKDEEPSNIYYDITGIAPSEVVMEVDGIQIPAELYFYWLAYACSNAEYQVNMLNAYYGLYSNLLAEDGSLVWDGELEEGVTLSQQAKLDGEGSVKFYASIEAMAKEQGVTLTDEDKADMDKSLADAKKQYGGDEAFQDGLRQMGISQETFERISGDTHLFDHLREQVLDPSSALYSELDSSAYVDHILLMTVDSQTNEPLSEEDAAAKYATAQELLSQLQATSDVEALFNELVGQYGEDPGRATEQGYLVNSSSNFVQSFKDTALSLEIGGLSGIVESEYGYHIMLRKPLTDSQRETAAGDHLSALLEERMAGASITYSDKLNDIDAGSFYNKYSEILQAEAEASAQGEGQTGSGDAGDAGSPDDAGTVPGEGGSGTAAE